MATQVSATLASTLPIAQRQLLECIRWRAAFPAGSADERLLSLDLLSVPIAAAHTCVTLARQVCQLLKSSARGRPPASIPRAIQRTEALFCFLENTARTHHIAKGDTDDEFTVHAVREKQTEDSSDSTRSPRRAPWQPEAAREAEESSPTDTAELRDLAGEVEEEEEEEEEDIGESSDDEGFRVVRKRKAGAQAVKEKEVEEEEAAYTIVVTKPVKARPKANGSAKDV